MRVPVILLMIVLVLSTACQARKERGLTREEFNRQKQLVERANRQLVKQDKELIESYIARRQWDMQISGSGLYYQIWERGTGPEVDFGNHLLLDYEVSLIDGTPCYSSQEAGPKDMILGRGDEESGLMQGLQMLREGDRARFILPPHMAHGLLGDANKIPPRSIVIYEVEVLKVY